MDPYLLRHKFSILYLNKKVRVPYEKLAPNRGCVLLVDTECVVDENPRNDGNARRGICFRPFTD